MNNGQGYQPTEPIRNKPPKTKRPLSVDWESQRVNEAVEDLKYLQTRAIESFCQIHDEIYTLIFDEEAITQGVNSWQLEELEKLSKVYESLASAYNSIFGGTKYERRI